MDNMSELSLLIHEYDVGVKIGEGYANRTYNIFYFTSLVYAGVIVLKLNSNEQIQQLLIFLYFLPIITYMLGLFYMYNSYVITRQGYYMIKLEIAIKVKQYYETKKITNFVGWNTFAKIYNGHLILAYGTGIMFYYLLPIFDFVYGIFISEGLFSYQFLDNNILNKIFLYLPFALYICFLIFASMINSKTISLYREMYKNGIKCNIEDVVINTKIKT